MKSPITRFGGFFVACVLAMPAHAITVTEVTKPVMCTWKDVHGAQFSVKCAYLAAIYLKAKRRCYECDWSQKRI